MSCISATYDYAALQATACPICTEDKHCVSYRAACPIPFPVTYPVLRPYLHDDTTSHMMTSAWAYIATKTRLTQEFESRFYIV